jgi:glycosyltransferase involved in cell wall biosynthesis
MVGQPAAGDAGNARFHTELVHALQITQDDGDDVAALIAHPAARPLLGETRCIEVPAANVARLATAIPRALRSHRSDALVVSYIAPPRTPCPVAVVVHDITFRLHPEWFSPRVKALLGTMVPWSMRRASVIITVSERSKTDIVNEYGIDPARVAIVTNVPAAAFTPDPTAAERVARDHGLDRYVLFVGDVHPRKNLTALAAAMRLLDDPTLRLVVVGRIGHQGEQILAGAKATWLGPQGDAALADLYRAATVTCYPSLYEGFGLPIVEAMACGSPVVATTRGAIPEVAGDAALLVEPTPEALAEGIRAALDPGTADRLRAAGPPRAARFTSREMGAAAWVALRGLR